MAIICYFSQSSSVLPAGKLSISRVARDQDLRDVTRDGERQRRAIWGLSTTRNYRIIAGCCGSLVGLKSLNARCTYVHTDPVVWPSPYACANSCPRLPNIARVTEVVVRMRTMMVRPRVWGPFLESPETFRAHFG